MYTMENRVWNIEIIPHVFPFDLKFILGVILIRNNKSLFRFVTIIKVRLSDDLFNAISFF